MPKPPKPPPVPPLTAMVCGKCRSPWLSIERQIRPAVPAAGIAPGEGTRPLAVASRYRLLCGDCGSRWSVSALAAAQSGAKKAAAS